MSWRVLGIKDMCENHSFTTVSTVQSDTAPGMRSREILSVENDHNKKSICKNKADLKCEDTPLNRNWEIANVAKESIVHGTVSLVIYLEIFQLTTWRPGELSWAYQSDSAYAKSDTAYRRLVNQ